MCHRRAIDLGVDVAHQVGVHVDVLDQRQRVVGVGAAGVALKHVQRAVAAQLRLQLRAVQPAAQRFADQAHAVKVGLHRVARHALESGLGAQHARRPVGLGVQPAQQAKHRPAHAFRQRGAHLLFQHVQLVAAVAAKGLVTPIARKRHGDMLAGQLADAVGGDGGTVGEGLVVEMGQRVDEVEVVAADGFNAVVGAITLRHHAGKFTLVVGRVVEGDGTGVDGFARQTRHGLHHGAGVHTARQEGAQGHLGNHAQLDRLLQATHQLLAGLLQVHLAVELEVNVPVFARLAHAFTAADGQGVGGWQLAGLAEDGARFGHVAERKVLFDRQRVDFALEATARPLISHDRLEFRAEEQGAVVQHGVVHGLHTQPVARHEEGLAVAVPQGKGKHAAETLHALLAPLLPGVHDDFSVALGVKGVPKGLQFGDEVLVVVDLAIEDHHHGPVFIEQRLLTGGNVDDGQPAVAKAHARLDVHAAFVRAAVKL